VWGRGGTNGHKAGIASRTGVGICKEHEARSKEGKQEERGQGIDADDIRESCPNPCWLVGRSGGTRVDNTPVIHTS